MSVSLCVGPMRREQWEMGGLLNQDWGDGGDRGDRSDKCNHAAATAAKSLQSCPTLRDSMDCSLPGFSVHGIFQARVPEWVAIAFSEM